ncbi:MAG: hypothetical protein HY812_16550 [Planctomycetes bacterium]|nr:hypothetical protein [Planctomycetota bacterium]
MSGLSRSLVNAVLCLGALAATCAAVAALSPEPDPQFYGAKFRAFEETKDEYDIVFFGTSQTFYTLIPATIDRQLASAGLPLRSYNFGLFGAEGFEVDHMIERVLDLEPRRLKWIVAEWTQWSAVPRHEANLYTDRSIFWHTFGRTVEAVRSVWLSHARLGRKLAVTCAHLNLMCQRYSGYGQAKPILEALFPGGMRYRHELVVEEMREKRGNMSLQPSAEVTSIEAPAGDLDAFAELREGLDAENAAQVDLGVHNAHVQRRQIERMAAAGVEVLYFTLPGAGPAPEAYRLAERGDLPAFLGLNSAARYPGIYRPEFYFDRIHLNDLGAARASYIVGQALARYLKGEGRDAEKARPGAPAGAERGPR